MTGIMHRQLAINHIERHKFRQHMHACMMRWREYIVFQQ